MLLSDETWHLVSPFLKLYPIDVGEVRSIGPGRYWLDGKSRTFEARILPKPSAIMRREVGDFTAHHRFRTTQRFLENRDLERFVTVDSDRVFYVTDSFSGEPFEVSPSDVQDAVDNLSQLHRAMNGLTRDSMVTTFTDSAEEGISPPKPRYGQWIQALKQAASQFTTARVILKSKGLEASPEARLWSDWIARWEDLAMQSIQALEGSGYTDLAKQAEAKGEVAWNDYQISRLQRLDDGRTATLQLKDPVFDNRLYDLASLCQSVCAEGHAEGVVDAVSRYSGTHPLTSEEVCAVKAFAAFPLHAQTYIHQVRKNGIDSLDPKWRKTAELHHDASTRLLS